MTVLTLAGLGASIPPTWYRGIPGKRVVVDYPNTVLPGYDKNMATGLKNLISMLHSMPDVDTVIGHSMGAKVIQLALRQESSLGIDLSKYLWVCTGNPERPGGRGDRKGNGHPADCKARVIDIARRGDFWAMNGSVIPGMLIHVQYGSVVVGGSDNVVTSVVGNTTYLTAP